MMMIILSNHHHPEGGQACTQKLHRAVWCTLLPRRTQPSDQSRSSPRVSDQPKNRNFCAARAFGLGSVEARPSAPGIARAAMAKDR